MALAAVAWLASSCGGARGAGGAGGAGPVLLVAHGGVWISLACPGAGGAACAARQRPAPAVTSRCDGGRPGLDASGVADGALRPPPAAHDAAAASDAEKEKIAAQLAKTDPLAAAVPVEVRDALRADLDGDGKPDAAFAVRRGELDALLVSSSSNPIRLRILQFSDGEPIDILGAVDVDPARGGGELVVRVERGETVSYEALRDTGELVGQARCLTAR